jgi:ABC-type phosphate/phosphonate transport system substrate-binding protein
MSPVKFLANMPWYDLEELRPFTDRLWQNFAAELRQEGLSSIVPDSLNRNIDYKDSWAQPSLLFSQACGYDLAISHRDQLQLIGTPQYSAPGCRDNSYRSFIVVKKDSSFQSLAGLRGSRCAVNSVDSHSGMNALQALIAPLSRNSRFFSSVIFTGAHVHSLKAISSGLADVAAIDCVTYELLQRVRPQAIEHVRILQTSPSAAAPPYVCSSALPGSHAAAIFRALKRTLARPDMTQVKAALLLDDVDFCASIDYQNIYKSARIAREHGYRELALQKCSSGIPKPKRRIIYKVIKKRLSVSPSPLFSVVVKTVDKLGAKASDHDSIIAENGARSFASVYWENNKDQSNICN